MTLIIRWLVNAIALLGISYYLPGVLVESYYTALVTALILGLVNVVISPIILFFTLPLNFITLGLFTLVINGFLFWFVSTIVDGFTVVGFMTAFWGALIMTVVGWVLSVLLKK